MTAENINSDLVIAPAILATAHKLADAYGHEWARCINPAVQPSGWTTRAIEDACHALAYEGQFGGIIAPTVHADGSISHVSGTGRLSWHIFQDTTGDVRVNFEIRRPIPTKRSEHDTGCVIDCDINMTRGKAVTCFVPNGIPTRGPVNTTGWAHLYEPFKRHWAALAEAVERCGIEDWRSVEVIQDLGGDTWYNWDAGEHQSWRPLGTLGELCAKPDPAAEVLRRMAGDIYSCNSAEELLQFVQRELERSGWGAKPETEPQPSETDEVHPEELERLTALGDPLDVEPLNE